MIQDLSEQNPGISIVGDEKLLEKNKLPLMTRLKRLNWGFWNYLFLFIAFLGCLGELIGCWRLNLNMVVYSMPVMLYFCALGFFF